MAGKFGGLAVEARTAKFNSANILIFYHDVDVSLTLESGNDLAHRVEAWIIIHG